MHGFELKKPRLVERRIDHLRQGMEFLPGTGHLDGKYTVNVYWSYLLSPIQDDYSMHATKRIGFFDAGRDTWYGREDEQDFEHVKTIILGKVVPYLESYNAIDKILTAIEEEKLRLEDAFPVDAGWREFYLGYCYLTLGDAGKARIHLEGVVKRHSDYPQAWVAERMKVCAATLAELSAT